MGPAPSQRRRHLPPLGRRLLRPPHLRPPRESHPKIDGLEGDGFFATSPVANLRHPSRTGPQWYGSGIATRMSAKEADRAAGALLGADRDARVLPDQ